MGIITSEFPAVSRALSRKDCRSRLCAVVLLLGPLDLTVHLTLEASDFRSICGEQTRQVEFVATSSRKTITQSPGFLEHSHAVYRRELQF